MNFKRGRWGGQEVVVTRRVEVLQRNGKWWSDFQMIWGKQVFDHFFRVTWD